MNLNDMREQRGKLITDARAISDGATAAGLDMTAEQSEKFDKLMDKADELRSQIQRAERLDGAERELAEKAGEKAEERSGGNPEERSAQEQADFSIEAFRSFIARGREGLNGEQLRALQFDNNEKGGFLAPPMQFVNTLIKGLDDMVFMRQRANVQNISGAHSMGAPSLDADPEDGTWTSEIGSVDEDTQMDFGQRELTPHQSSKLLKVSMKLLRNAAMPVETIVADRLGYKFGITEEAAFLTGSGASQPLGVFTASSQGISTGRDISTGNTTTAIGADGLIEAKFALKGQYHNTAEWLFHRDAIKAISKLKDGEGQYLWQPGLQAGSPDMLLGRPVLMSEKAPNTFTTGLYVGIIGDFSNYWIAQSMQMEIQRLNELYAATSQIGFIGRMWVDGMPVLEEAFARVTLA